MRKPREEDFIALSRSPASPQRETAAIRDARNRKPESGELVVSRWSFSIYRSPFLPFLRLFQLKHAAARKTEFFLRAIARTRHVYNELPFPRSFAIVEMIQLASRIRCVTPNPHLGWLYSLSLIRNYQLGSIAKLKLAAASIKKSEQRRGIRLLVDPRRSILCRTYTLRDARIWIWIMKNTLELSLAPFNIHNIHAI